jgi:hypothetical protein
VQIFYNGLCTGQAEFFSDWIIARQTQCGGQIHLGKGGGLLSLSNCSVKSSLGSALSSDIGGHVYPQFTLWYMLSVLLLTFCRSNLSDCPASSPIVVLCPFILPVVTIFFNFPFLKMCQLKSIKYII